MVIYGPSGVGKTELAAHFPNAGFLYDPQEPGIVDLLAFRKVPEPMFKEKVIDHKDHLRMLEKVASGKLECETLVEDSLTGFEKLCFHHHCNEHYNGDLTKEGFYAYGQGPKQAAKFDWSDYIDLLDAVREAGINVILLAHAQVKPYNNPEGPDYDRFIPYLDKETWQAIHRWAQSLLFYNYCVSTEKKGLKTKAKDGERQIVTSWTPAADAKNRYGLPQYIEAGCSGKEAYENFEAAFRKAAGL